MKLYSSGERIEAICDSCRKVVSATFAYRDVPLSDGSDKVKDILVAVCDVCRTVVATPPQSTPAIKAAREKAKSPLELRIAAPYVEALDLAAFRIDPNATPEFRKHLIALYIHRSARAPKTSVRKLNAALAVARKTKLPKKVPMRRLSFKVTAQLNEDLGVLVQTSKLSKSDIVRALLLQIRDELVTPNAPKDLNMLKELAAISALGARAS